MNEHFEYSLRKLRVDCEELEKRLKSLEKSISNSSQNTKNEIEQELNSISQELTNCKTTVDSLSSSVSQNTSKSTENSTKIASINTKISQLNEQITQIPAQIENFSQLVNGLKMVDDTKLIYEDFGVNEDMISTTVNSYTHWSQYYSQTYYLICDINQPIDIDFEVGFDPTIQNMFDTYEYTIELFINNTSFLKGSYPCASESSTNTQKVNNLSERYYPEKTINEIRVHCQGYTFCVVQYYKIKFNGKNLTICGQVPSLYITCFDNKYFVCNKSDKNVSKIFFAEFDKDSLTLDTENYKSAKVLNTNINEKLSIYPAYNLSTKEYVKILNYDHMLFPTLESRDIENAFYVHFYDPSGDKLYSYIDADKKYKVEDYDFIFTGKRTCYACFCIVQSNGEAGLYCTPDQDKLNYVKLTFNGEPLPLLYHKCAMVKNNNITSQDDSISITGVILWNISTQNWEFFEAVDSTYKVIIAPGKYCTAYLQTNGNINVYISRGCTTYKYVLSKNTETDKYELSPLYSIIPKATKYDELYDGKALITFYDNYRIYIPSE